VLRGNFIAKLAFIKKNQRAPQINNLMMHRRLIKKHKSNRWKEIINSRAEINEM
jgi:hypothetical protein